MPLPEIPWFGSAPREARYLAGISGGADSVALLHLLHEHGFRDVVVCHLNHGLRGAESDGDADFVKELAERLGYLCEIAVLPEGTLAGQSGQSLETAARQARHHFFASCAARYECLQVLLGHHRDDQAETILWNLLRGSRGFQGMRNCQSMTVRAFKLMLLRPLLGTGRTEIRAWLTERNLPWREDATNAEPFAARNRLRNEVLPLLEEIAMRDVTASIVRAAGSTQDLAEIQAWAVKQAQVLDPQGRLHVPKLLTLPPALQAACIFDYLQQAGIPDLSREVVIRCVAILEPGAPSATNLPGGHIFRRRQGRIFIETSSS